MSDGDVLSDEAREKIREHMDEWAEEMLQELIDYHVVTRIRFEGEDEWKEVDDSPQITLRQDDDEDDEPMPGSVFRAQNEDTEGRE